MQLIEIRIEAAELVLVEVVAREVGGGKRTAVFAGTLLSADGECGGVDRFGSTRTSAGRGVVTAVGVEDAHLDGFAVYAKNNRVSRKVLPAVGFQQFSEEPEESSAVAMPASVTA